jgi:hypothetical protein
MDYRAIERAKRIAEKEIFLRETHFLRLDWTDGRKCWNDEKRHHKQEEEEKSDELQRNAGKMRTRGVIKRKTRRKKGEKSKRGLLEQMLNFSRFSVVKMRCSLTK